MEEANKEQTNRQKSINPIKYIDSANISESNVGSKLRRRQETRIRKRKTLQNK